MSEIREYQEGLLWRIDEAETVLIGVTQNALDAAGAVAEIDAADVGDEFEAGDWIGELRGKNSVVEIVAPYGLRVVERNEQVISQPGSLEDDPTGDAWIVRVERIDG